MQESNYPIAWTEDYSMQIGEIDAQHKHFISILNNLYSALEKNELKQKAEYILKDLANYAVNHFATEEKYFDLYKYEFADEHRLEHKKLLEKVGVFMDRFSSEGTNIVPELLDFLEDWLVQHLNNQDKRYVDCFKQNGLV